MKEYLQKEYEITEIRYYTGVKSEDEKMSGFLRYLDAVGIIPVTKPIKVIKIDGSDPQRKIYNYHEIYKSNCDIEITTDVLLERSTVDEIVLFTGDSDFQYLAKKLKDLGKKVTILSSRKTISWEMKLESSRYIYLEDIKESVIRK